MILRNWQLYLFVLPAVVYYIVFHYVPIYGVQIAFRQYYPMRGILGSPWVGMKHFMRFFNSYYFTTVIGNTLRISLTALIVGFPIPVLLALMLNEVQHLRFKKLVQTVTYAPHFISMVVMVGMLILFLTPSSGIINHMLAAVGMERKAFMQDARNFHWIYVFSSIWQESGWSSVIFVAALASIDSSQVEAAIIDGANKLQRMVYINLPVLIPTIVIMLIMRSGSILSVGFEKVYLMQNATNLSRSEIISTYVYKAGLIDGDFSFAAAVGLFNSLINFAILVLVNLFARRVGETSLW